jgi:hypothetical protein
LIGALSVGWLLWRVQLQMFINQTFRSRQAGRIAATIGGAIVILLAWSWEVTITLVFVAASHRLALRIDLVQLLGLAFFGYTAILIFSSLVFSLNALLLNPDLDLLLAAPRPVESILGGRLVVQVLRLTLLSLLFTGPALVVIALAYRDVFLLLGFTALYLLYPVYVVVIVSLLSLLVVRIVPPGRGREIVTILGVLLALGVNLANFLINPAFRGPGPGFRPRVRPSLPDIPAASSPWLPWGWAGRAAAAILSANWLVAIEWLAVLFVVSAVLFGIGAVLSGRLYLAGWVQAVTPRRHRRAVTLTPGRRSRFPLLSPLEAAIVVKDWHMRTRDLAQLVRFLMPVVFLFLIFGLRFSGILTSVRGLGEGPAAATIALVPAWVLLFSLALSLGLSAVSLEGKAIWLYAASPNSTLALLQAKCWSASLPTAALVGLVAVAAELVVRPGSLWAIAAVIAVVAVAAGVTTLMVGVGAIFARFDWTDTRRMTSPLAVFIGMALFAGVSLGVLLLFGISLAFSSALRFPLFSTWLAAISIAVGATASVAALGLLVGNERLRGLELG